MNCEKCGNNPATVHFTEIVNNNVVSMHLCRPCADERGFSFEQSTPYGLGDLVAGLLDSAGSAEAERIGRVQCPSCRFEYSEFKKLGRLGCPDCYDAFAAQLVPVLRHVHGSTQHTGKVPAEERERVQALARITALRDDLEQAIKAEAYEKAAALRDEIRRLEESESQ